MSRSTLVTGGAGFIGSHLVERLLELGDDVYVVDDLSAGGFDNLKHVRSNPALHLVVDSALNGSMMGEVVGKVDRVYHLAAAVGIRRMLDHPVETISTNVRGTEVVLECCARFGKPVFLASSSEVYGKAGDVLREDADLIVGSIKQGRWAYAGTKIMDEFMALAYHRERDLPVVIGRFFNVVGPRQKREGGMVLPNFVAQAIAWEPITVYGSGRQRRCFCHVSDAVTAMTGLMDQPEAVGDVFNIGGQDEIAILELAERVKNRTASESPIEVIPYDEAYEKGFEDLARRKPDITRVRELLGWCPSVGIDQTIDEVASYYRGL